MIGVSPPATRVLGRLRHVSRGAWLRLAYVGTLSIVALGPTLGPTAESSLAQGTGDWPSLQGGAAHLGSAPDGVQPALKIAWQGRSGATGSGLSAAVFAPGLAVADAPTSVVGLDPQTGVVLWTVPRSRGPLDPPAIDPTVGKHGVIVYPEGVGKIPTGVAAIDLTDHHRLWQYALSKPARGAPAIQDGTVYIGGQDDFVYAIDAESGALRWKVKTAGSIDAAPAVAGGKVFAVVEDETARTSRVYALNATDGAVAWKYATRSLAAGTVIPAVTSPAVADGIVYVGLGDVHLHALDAATGRQRWAATVRSIFDAFSSPAVANGSVYVADAGGSLYRFNANNGSKLWDYEFPSATGSGAPLVLGQTAYIGLQDGTIAAVDSAGYLVWTTKLTAGAVGALTPAGELVLVPMTPFGKAKGGIAAFQHDPAGLLEHVPSPTKLRLGVALGNYAAAFLITIVLLLVIFRIGLLRRRSSSEVGPAPPRKGGAA